ncbi:DUF6114 domain-containing protein [Micromonospora lupini]|uniref:Uncharacterized protein n=1 Tax=Micromonospora lupini str. Lupac 08 TaxID=1150864 RepID=I0LE11_9ACTN|nr:DUF6114 domain-containing protein [Micromonospora lupini]CCH22058.1 Conserved hypothetical protein [Micromonospora lupini str. Lupac 08]
MSTATHRAQPGRVGRAWRGFRRWRRSRPFWGGLFTLLAGVEILGTTKVSLAGLTLQMGPTGFLSWLIPAILVTCGLLMWLSPAQRIFYAVVGAVTAVYSLIGVNLGGFFIGMLLGMVGSALGFAWVPAKRAAAVPPPAADEPDGPLADDGETSDEPPLVDELLPAREWEDEATGPLTDVLPQARRTLREPAPAQPASDTTEALPVIEPDAPQTRSTMARDPKTYVVTLLLMSLASAGLTTIDGASPVRAAEVSCPTPSSSAQSSTPAAPSASPSLSPTPSATSEKSDGNLFTDIVDGIGDLFTGDDDKAEPSTTESSAVAKAEPTSSAARAGQSATPSATPTRTASATPRPTGTATATPDAPCVSPKPTKPAPAEPGKPLPKLAADPDMPKVAATPAKLTGSKVVMTNLRFRGVEPLHTANGEMKALKFTMSKAVTSDFALLVAGPSGGSLLSETNELTIDGDVTFYATRFVGRFLGIKVTLTPDLPFPDGIPITSPLPLTFTDPQIDLAFISCHTLTGRPTLRQTLH